MLYCAPVSISRSSVPRCGQHYLWCADAGVKHHLQRGGTGIYQHQQVREPVFRGGAVTVAMLLHSWRTGHSQRFQFGELGEQHASLVWTCAGRR